MDLSQTLPSQTSGPNPAMATKLNDSQSSTSQLSSDFEVFLRMLTAQMQYQDPLNPVDSTDYATQLATFSGVEQAVMTNDLLTSLTTQLAVGGLSDLASWVGREARSDAPANFGGQPIEIFPKSIGAADSTEIIVRNAAGDEVQRLPYTPSDGSLLWAGVQPDGSPMPVGLYSFQVIGSSNGEVISEAGVNVYSGVTEVRIESGQTVLVLEGGAQIPSTEVTALRDKTA